MMHIDRISLLITQECNFPCCRDRLRQAQNGQIWTIMLSQVTVNHSVKTEGHLYQAVTGEPTTMQSSAQQYVKLQQLRDQGRVENCGKVRRRSRRIFCLMWWWRDILSGISREQNCIWLLFSSYFSPKTHANFRMSDVLRKHRLWSSS